MDTDAQPPENMPADAPGLRARSFVFEGLWVAEVEIGEVGAGAPLPLVVMLHGRGDRPRIPGGPFGRVPTPMRVLIPRGPLSLGGGFAWARHSVTQGRYDELAQDMIAVSDRLARLIAYVESIRPTLGSAIVTGFSQGAILAWTTALRHPERVGLAIPIAGWVPPGARPSPLGGAPTRAMHGTNDRIVRVEATRDLVALLNAAGTPVDWREFDGIGHEVTPEMNLAFETWLEEGLSDRAPDLTGGPGLAGRDPSPVEPHEPPADIDLAAEALPAPVLAPEDEEIESGAVGDSASGR